MRDVKEGEYSPFKIGDVVRVNSAPNTESWFTTDNLQYMHEHKLPCDYTTLFEVKNVYVSETVGDTRYLIDVFYHKGDPKHYTGGLSHRFVLAHRPNPLPDDLFTL